MYVLYEVFFLSSSRPLYLLIRSTIIVCNIIADPCNVLGCFALHMDRHPLYSSGPYANHRLRRQLALLVLGYWPHPCRCSLCHLTVCVSQHCHHVASPVSRFECSLWRHANAALLAHQIFSHTECGRDLRIDVITGKRCAGSISPGALNNSFIGAVACANDEPTSPIGYASCRSRQ